MDTTDKILFELTKFENLNPKYSDELLLISKTIRNKVWNTNNQEILYRAISVMNSLYMFFHIEINTNSISFYIKQLQKFFPFNHEFEELRYKVLIISNSKLISQQWVDIYRTEEDYKSFYEIFDEVYCNFIDKNLDIFAVDISEHDILCRACEGQHLGNPDRFVPNLKYVLNNNRWNPPDRAFLYLSYAQNENACDSDLTLSEFTCLAERRAEIGEINSVCRFMITAPTRVIDLSFNDITSDGINKPIDKQYNILMDKIKHDFIIPTLSDPTLLEEYKRNPDKLRTDIEKEVDKDMQQTRQIIMVSLVKQYLKMICDCIYVPVEESTLLEPYKPFHHLAKYIEGKGLKGIIYPSTRTKKDKNIDSKNLVLFDPFDAKPLENSIKIVALH